MENYGDAVGEVDVVIITARHGGNHYKYAKPYLTSKVPIFIDKPITANLKDGIEFMNKMKASGIRVNGAQLFLKPLLVLHPVPCTEYA